MILKRRFLEGIANGTVTLAFRKWTRPTVRGGGSLLTPIGRLEIRSVSPIDPGSISGADAERAGYSSRDQLLRELSRRSEGTCYRIELGALGPDPRVALRETAIASDDELGRLLDRLRKLDERATGGPWTRQVLELIAARPAVRAADLSAELGRDKPSFKLDVRKLKALGLTESLEVGYRLSPRGAALLAHLRSARS